MKAILMSIRPEWVAKILNGEKTIEIRKKFPKDYVGWVYIYCTKGKPFLKEGGIKPMHDLNPLNPFNYDWFLDNDDWCCLNGKVVARFWCDKVETFRCNVTGNLKDGFFKAKPYCKVIEDGIANYNCDGEFEDILKNAQITNKELAQYLGDKECPYGGWYIFNAIHITKLEIFDKPKELWQFKTLKNAERYKHDLEQAYKDDYEIGTRIAEGIANDDECANCVELTELSEGYYGLQKPPQSWCFVEI